VRTSDSKDAGCGSRTHVSNEPRCSSCVELSWHALYFIKYIDRCKQNRVIAECRHKIVLGGGREMRPRTQEWALRSLALADRLRAIECNSGLRPFRGHCGRSRGASRTRAADDRMSKRRGSFRRAFAAMFNGTEPIKACFLPPPDRSGNRREQPSGEHARFGSEVEQKMSDLLADSPAERSSSHSGGTARRSPPWHSMPGRNGGASRSGPLHQGEPSPNIAHWHFPPRAPSGFPVGARGDPAPTRHFGRR
jgi:hypothetical protein